MLSTRPCRNPKCRALYFVCIYIMKSLNCILNFQVGTVDFHCKIENMFIVAKLRVCAMINGNAELSMHWLAVLLCYTIRKVHRKVQPSIIIIRLQSCSLVSLAFKCLYYLECRVFLQNKNGIILYNIWLARTRKQPGTIEAS
jgi:hypothetical protein